MLTTLLIVGAVILSFDSSSYAQHTTEEQPVCSPECPEDYSCKFRPFPCKDGEFCIEIVVAQCVRTVDQCDQCQSGDQCKSTGIVCVTTPCPSFECIRDPTQEQSLSRDPCRYFVCLNGGSCTAPADAPYCECPPNFTGNKCEDRIGDIPLRRCPRIVTLPFLRCQFKSQYCDSDLDCNEFQNCCYKTGCGRRVCTYIDTDNRDPCLNFNCLNGGNCTAPADVPYCQCPAEYTGQNCETRTTTLIPDGCPVIGPNSIGICGGIFCSDDSDCPDAQICCPSACGGNHCT